MKMLLLRRVLLSLSFVASLAATPAWAASYAQISSSETQLGDTTPKRVTLNQDDALAGVANARAS